MDLELDPEQQAVVDTTRAFVRAELVPHEESVERAGQLDAELATMLRAKAIRSGLYAANMPEEVGGGGLDTLTWMLMERELGWTGCGCVRATTNMWPLSLFPRTPAACAPTVG